ncbi:hypothetical protein J6590_001899 [Homalodisca vitripennis]|nr:hypothetical protein J6590_001899 [Homalodisca vitripennis]
MEQINSLSFLSRLLTCHFSELVNIVMSPTQPLVLDNDPVVDSLLYVWKPSSSLLLAIPLLLLVSVTSSVLRGIAVSLGYCIWVDNQHLARSQQ